MLKLTRRHVMATGMATGISLGAGIPAKAESTISLVSPYGAGGSTDLFLRKIAEHMSKTLDRTVIVENKPGANGILAANYVTSGPADGTRLLAGTTGVVSLNPMLRADLPFKSEDLRSVAMLYDGPLSISVPTALGVKTIEELVAFSKENNRPLRHGTLGPGSVSDLFGLQVRKVLDVETVPVAYPSSADSLVDLLAGQAEFSNQTPQLLLEYQKSGDIDILAVTTIERDPLFPDIPSVGELGYPALESSYWTAIHAPAAVPDKVIKSLSEAAVSAMESDEISELLKVNGLTNKTGGPEVLDQQLAKDKEFWGALIKEFNIAL